jgi:hypothetical protein
MLAILPPNPKTCALPTTKVLHLHVNLDSAVKIEALLSLSSSSLSSSHGTHIIVDKSLTISTSPEKRGFCILKRTKDIVGHGWSQRARADCRLQTSFMNDVCALEARTQGHCLPEVCLRRSGSGSMANLHYPAIALLYRSGHPLLNPS